MTIGEMAKSNHSSSLKQDRKLTDESLVTERNKTDKSLEDLQNKTERETDEQVKSDRKDADEARTQSRSGTDTVIREAAGDSFQKLNTIQKQRAVKKGLQEQRQSDDYAVETERSHMDEAIRKERALKEGLLNKSVDKEREETDENLLRERKRTDSVAQRSSELLANEQSSHSATKAALTTRDELLAIVSHDLRNPIATVVSYAELLLEDTSSAQTANKSKEWGEVIKRNAETSLRLISDLLDMERFAEGKLELRLARYNLQDLVQSSVESLVHLAAKKKILLRAIPSNSSMLGFCDRDRIAQVLSNLIGNALKFTPQDGTVTLKVQRTEKELEVSVSDTGPGISVEQQKRIFDRFAQLKNRDRSGLVLGFIFQRCLLRHIKENFG
jgi:signal transduction histidine kinase